MQQYLCTVEQENTRHENSNILGINNSLQFLQISVLEIFTYRNRMNMSQNSPKTNSSISVFTVQL